MASTRAAYRIAAFNGSFAKIMNGKAACSAALPAALRFRWPQLNGEFIQHAVHIFITIGAAERLCQLDRFVDHHAIRNVQVMLELERRDHQHRPFDRRKLFERTVEARLQFGGNGVRFLDHAVQDGVQMFLVGFIEALRAAQLRVYLAAGRTRQQPLIKPLCREFARASSSAFHARSSSSSSSSSPPSCSSATDRFAISTATRAASRPFSVMRATACSSFSVVRIALATGVPKSSAIRETPAPLSFDTSSKWYVSPRITAPSAINASNCPDSASFCSASGISSAPGTVTSSTSSPITPSRSSSSVQASTRPLQTGSLKRDCTMPMRSPSPSRFGWYCPISIIYPFSVCCSVVVGAGQTERKWAMEAGSAESAEVVAGQPGIGMNPVTSKP